MSAMAVPLGMAAAWRPGSSFDHLTELSGLALYALPVFWAALVLQLAFAVRLEWLPLYGLESTAAGPAGSLSRVFDRGRHLVLPVVCLAYPGLAHMTRFVRASLAEAVSGERARAARARGLAPSDVLLRHGLREAAVPLLTLAGFLLPGLVGGSVLVETIFAIPGMGSLFTEAVLSRDIPVVMGLTFVSGATTLAGVVLSDLASLMVDPRLRRG